MGREPQHVGLAGPDSKERVGCRRIDLGCGPVAVQHARRDAPLRASLDLWSRELPATEH